MCYLIKTESNTNFKDIAEKINNVMKFNGVWFFEIKYDINFIIINFVIIQCFCFFCITKCKIAFKI